MLRIKRVYDAPAPDDGLRVLVDRLWPRGLTKDKARVDIWLKDVSPSTALRKAAHADPDGWEQFLAAYDEELAAEPARAAAADLLSRARHEPVTLLFGARDGERNNAAALKAHLERLAGT